MVFVELVVFGGWVVFAVFGVGGHFETWWAVYCTGNAQWVRVRATQGQRAFASVLRLAGDGMARLGGGQ